MKILVNQITGKHVAASLLSRYKYDIIIPYIIYKIWNYIVFV